MRTRACAFAHRLFPDLRRRRSKHPVGPSAPGRRRTCPPRTALSSRRLGRDRRLLEVKDVPVGNRSPRSACLPAVIRSRLRPGATRTGFGSCGMRRPTPPPGTPGGPAVSMALTSTLHLRCTPWRNRRIPTFPLGLLDVGLLDVSAVDTGPRDSCGTARRPPPGPHPTGSLRGARSGPGDGGPTSALARAFSEPPLRHESRDLLAKGCAHCTKAPSTRSTPAPQQARPSWSTAQSGINGAQQGRPRPKPHSAYRCT